MGIWEEHYQPHCTTSYQKHCEQKFLDKCHTEYTTECKEGHERQCKTEYDTQCKTEYAKQCSNEYHEKCETEYIESVTPSLRKNVGMSLGQIVIRIPSATRPTWTTVSLSSRSSAVAVVRKRGRSSREMWLKSWFTARKKTLTKTKTRMRIWR